jgi:hypothetical protein
MTAPGYEIDRAITLTILIIYLFFCFFQLFAAHRLQVVETKHYTHILNAISAFILLFSVIDLDGAFGIFGYLPFLILCSIGGQISMITLCLIIINHFKASYLSLKQEMPTNLLWSLALSILSGFIMTPLGFALAYTKNLQIYLSIAYLGGLQEIAILGFYDLWGYLKIRSLLIDTIQLERPNYRGKGWRLCCDKPSQSRTLSTSNSPRSAHLSGASYEDLLSRIWKFHAVFISLAICYALYAIIVVLVMFGDKSRPYVQPDAVVYEFDFVIHASIGGLFLFTWWAWIPAYEAVNKMRESRTGVSTTANSEERRTELQSPRAYSHHQTLHLPNRVHPGQPPPHSPHSPHSPQTEKDSLISDLEISTSITPKMMPAVVSPSIIQDSFIFNHDNVLPETTALTGGGGSGISSPLTPSLSSSLAGEDLGVSRREGSISPTKITLMDTPSRQSVNAKSGTEIELVIPLDDDPYVV